jgi:hypothetical protein
MLYVRVPVTDGRRVSLRQSTGGQEPWLQELGEYLLAHGAGGPEEVHGIIDR